MSNYVIMTDACSDLPAQMADELGIIALPMTVTMDGVEYVGSLDEKYLTFKRFYELMETSKDVHTSAVSESTFYEYMEPELAAGRDILYLAFASVLSATYATAEMTAKALREKYPDRKIYVVDTQCASMGEGLLVYLAAQERQAGRTIEEVREFAERTKQTVVHWFTVDDLRYLQRGGRVSKTTAVVGSLLNIKPILMVDPEGRLTPHSKARGVKHAIKALLERMTDTIRDAAGQVVFISHASALDKARELAGMIRERFPNVKDVVINHIGPTVGAHAGPGTLALFFRGVRVPVTV